MPQVSEDNFASYMQEALYGQDGFYTKGGGAGRDRDYLTSPEVGDLFGFVIAGYIDKWYESLDNPEIASVIEVGSGPGSLAASISRAQMKHAQDIEYFLVDTSPSHRETSAKKLEKIEPDFVWEVCERIPSTDQPTLIIANELLDNLVFDIGEVENVYKEFKPDRKEGVTQDTYAAFGQFRDIDSLGSASVPRNIGNYRIPIHIGIADFFNEFIEATNQVSDLSILFIDYMKSVLDMEDGNWLRLYANNQRIVGIENVLEALSEGVIGDITTDVTKEDLLVLLDSEGFSRVSCESQKQWLFNQRIDDFVFEPQSKSSHDLLKSFVEGDVSAAVGASFIQEREVLLDEDGLGAFSVVTARRAI